MHERNVAPGTRQDCPLTPSESLEVANMAYTALQLPCPPDMSPEAGQPHRLHLLQALANSWGDPHMALLPFLQHGVPTGAVSALLAKKPDTAVPPDLEICEGNWKMAEDEPETVQSLLRNEIANNWIVETGLSLAEAREKWPLGIAVGKLNVVFAEGKEPRLVLDSTVRHVNTRCHLPERLSLPARRLAESPVRVLSLPAGLWRQLGLFIFAAGLIQ